MLHVYRHIRLDKNEPFYIGVGSGEKKKRAFDFSKRSSKWNDIYNQTKIRVDILFEEVTEDFAKEKERELIELYGRIDLGTGTLCNQTKGGESQVGYKHSKEVLQKLSQFAKKRGIYMLQTKEVYEKRANTHRGQKRSAETKERLAAWQRGVPKSKELIEKVRATKLLPENVEKSRNQKSCKKVMCIENGIIYRSLSEAGRQLNINPDLISRVAHGKYKITFGLTFKFV